MNLNEVVDALANRPDGPLGHVDFFALTWQCSHVRFCRGLWDADDYSRENALAWMLKRNEEDYKANWIESVANSELRTTTLEEISSSIDTAAKEIANSDHLANPDGLPIGTSDLSDAVLPLRIERLALYDFRPTAVFIWQRPAEFNYLELHYES